MIDDAGQPRVIEFNCRLGDPETQPILFRLRSDLVDVISSCFDGTLGNAPLEWDERATVGVVMASRGYPDTYDRGHAISGLEQVAGADVKVFHAGTRLDGHTIVTDGGRVLCVVGAGVSVRAACDTAYSGVRQISWDGAFYRKDIGHRAIERDASR
jgi:phosphoribosylamine--glycine ligase